MSLELTFNMFVYWVPYPTPNYIVILRWCQFQADMLPSHFIACCKPLASLYWFIHLNLRNILQRNCNLFPNMVKVVRLDIIFILLKLCKTEVTACTNFYCWKLWLIFLMNVLYYVQTNDRDTNPIVTKMDGNHQFNTEACQLTNVSC